MTINVIPPRQGLLGAAILISLLAFGWSAPHLSAQGADPVRAKQFYANAKCAICHSLDGKGGRVGPALDDAGKRWGPADKLFGFLKNPASVDASSSMPPMRGTDDEIRAVATYLTTLDGAPRVVQPEPNIAWGEQLFASRQCLYCHRLGEKGGQVGPRLDTEATRKRSPAFLLDHFKNPAALSPGTAMPALQASDAELQSLVYYIESLKPGLSLPSITLPSPGEGGSQPSLAEGEALYSAVTCNSCHSVGGKGGYLGPALDNEGGVGRNIAWVTNQFRQPDQTAPGTTMPVVQGTDRQLQSLAMYVLSLKAKVPATSDLGKKVYAQRGCAACHGSEEQGTSIGPSLVRTPSPRTDAWILDHFRDPASVTPHSVMPRIWAADWELQSLLEYLKTVRK